jgi:hypothetical protein
MLCFLFGVTDPGWLPPDWMLMTAAALLQQLAEARPGAGR